LETTINEIPPAIEAQTAAITSAIEGLGGIITTALETLGGDFDAAIAAQTAALMAVDPLPGVASLGDINGHVKDIQEKQEQMAATQTSMDMHLNNLQYGFQNFTEQYFGNSAAFNQNQTDFNGIYLERFDNYAIAAANMYGNQVATNTIVKSWDADIDLMTQIKNALVNLEVLQNNQNMDVEHISQCVCPT